MAIAFHQEGLARTLAQDSSRLSSIGGDAGMLELFHADAENDDQAMMPAVPLVGSPTIRLDPARESDDGIAIPLPMSPAAAAMLRLDPARGIDVDPWWQHSRSADVEAEYGALLDQPGADFDDVLTSQEENYVDSVEPLSMPQQTIETPPDAPVCEWADTPSAGLDAEPEQATLPLPASPAAPDAKRLNLQRWLSPLRMLRRLRRLFVRNAAGNDTRNRLFRRIMSAAPAPEPVDLHEPIAEDVRSPELAEDIRSAEPELVLTDAVHDRALEPAFAAEASCCEAIAVVESAQEPAGFEIPETVSAAESASESTAQARHRLELEVRSPVFLFAGEMSYAAGVDILTEALIFVCQTQQDVCFVLVGDGPLKGAMEEQVLRAGFAQRCRFTGDLGPSEFKQVLAACDFVAVPARETQDSGLASRALSLGKPVLATHAARIHGIVHGQNGLVAYDCANSLVWGLRELLAWPHPHAQPDFIERKAA